jgi:hypothetical protein
MTASRRKAFPAHRALDALEIDAPKLRQAKSPFHTLAYRTNEGPHLFEIDPRDYGSE